jgi:amino acid permease
MTATSIAIIILLVIMGLDAKHNHDDVRHTKIQPLGFASSFGTMLYSFGGHAMFPTFQTDMKEPRKFGTSCRIAYLSKFIS